MYHVDNVVDMFVVTLVYATGGREFWMLAWVVDMASSVVTPSATRAGTCRYHVDMCRVDMISKVDMSSA